MKNEEFCLQVDSHSDFINNWDDTLMSTWGSIGNEYAILSTQPVDISLLSEVTKEVPHVCAATFNT